MGKGGGGGGERKVREVELREFETKEGGQERVSRERVESNEDKKKVQTGTIDPATLAAKPLTIPVCSRPNAS